MDELPDRPVAPFRQEKLAGAERPALVTTLVQSPGDVEHLGALLSETRGAPVGNPDEIVTAVGALWTG